MSLQTFWLMLGASLISEIFVPLLLLPFKLQQLSDNSISVKTDNKLFSLYGRCSNQASEVRNSRPLSVVLLGKLKKLTAEKSFAAKSHLFFGCHSRESSPMVVPGYLLKEKAMLKGTATHLPNMTQGF